MPTALPTRRLARKVSTRARRTMLTPLLSVVDDPTLVRLGSPECGWWVPGDLGPGAVAYCAGAGEDISFDLELHRRGVEVVTLDPTPRAIAHVASVAPDDDRFTFVPMGLWDERAELTFYPPADTGEVSHSALNLQRTGAGGGFRAEVDSLGSVMAACGHDHIDLLKIDIEGGESRVLPQLLLAGPLPPVICFEYDQPQSSLALLRLLRAYRERGYRLVRRERWNFTLRR